MFFYVIGAAFVHASVLGIILFTDEAAFISPQHVLGALLILVGVPVATIWLTAEGVDAAAPRRRFDARVCRPGANLIAGALTGAAGTAGMLIGLAYLSLGVTDARITALSAAGATLLVVLPMRRIRNLRCPACDYDLSGATPTAGGLCAECGLPLVPARARIISASPTPSAASPPANLPPRGCP